MITRRSYLQAVGAALGTSAVAGRSSGRCSASCEFCRFDDQGSEMALSGEPDFTVDSEEMTHRVYWRPQEHFKEKFAPWTIAYAAVDGDYVVLNEGQQSRVNSTVVAHEIGHNLGYEHVDGTLMASTVESMDDRSPEVSMADITRDVFAAMGDAVVCNWTGEDGRDQVLELVERHINGELTREATLYGIRRYLSGAEADAYYHSSWENFGAGNGVSLSGHFYRET